jgi:hypothetical protein
MARTETETTAVVAHQTGNPWLAGIAGGLAGGVVFGLMMQIAMPMPVIEEMIPALYTLGPGLGIGWAIHLFHSAVFGLLYAAIVRSGRLAEYASRLGTGAGLGIAYGLIVWVVAASFLMPAWIGAVTPMSPPVPDVNPMSALGHAVYGLLLGAVYPLIAGR